MTGSGKPIGIPALQLVGGVSRLLRGRVRYGGSFTGVGAPVGALMPGDPAAARQIYRGIFAFAGHSVSCRPAEVFTVLSPSAAWWDEITSFEWLAHFEAADLALYRAFSRAMVTTFASQRLATNFAADCRRLAALSRHAGFLLNGASEDYSADFLAIATGEARRLAKARPRAAVDQLWQALALLTAGLSFRGAPILRAESLARCAALTAVVILGDGGAVDRNPLTLLKLLAGLIPVREALAVQRISVPEGVDAAIRRGLAALRLLSHGGGLAVLQGVETVRPAALSPLLAPCDEPVPPVWRAPQSGFCRMSQGAATVIVDCGEPAACDSALAFEFSDGGQRIAGSCGVPVGASSAWRRAACSAAAHTIVQIEGAEMPGAPSFLSRRGSLPSVAAASPHGVLFKGSSSLAAASLGIVQRRDLFLAANGYDLRGEDSFARAEGHAGDWPDLGFCIRFHLAPGLRATLDRPGSAVTLVMPDRAVWQVTVRGGEIYLEDSIFLATGGAPEPCRQIVVRGRVGRPDRINWAFKKLAAG